MIYRLITKGTIEERMMELTKKKMILEHLVVGKLKTQNINQEELDDIIRHGSMELFADESEEAKARQIHYVDAAIDSVKITTTRTNQSSKANGEGNSGKGVDQGSKSQTELPKDYIHVRATRGQATDSHSLAERARREKISERMKLVQDIVPGCNKKLGGSMDKHTVEVMMLGEKHQAKFEKQANVWAYFSVKSGGGIHEFSYSQFEMGEEAKTIVPESVLKKQKREQEWALVKKQERDGQKKKNVENRKLICTRAKQYAREYSEKEKETIRLKREAKLRGGFYVEPEAELLFIVRIRRRTKRGLGDETQRALIDLHTPSTWHGSTRSEA